MFRVLTVESRSAAHLVISYGNQSSRRVRREALEAPHLANLRRYGDEVAPIEIEVLDPRQLVDGRGKRDDRTRVPTRLPKVGAELFTIVRCGFVDLFEEQTPGSTVRVLYVRMKFWQVFRLGAIDRTNGFGHRNQVILGIRIHAFGRHRFNATFRPYPVIGGIVLPDR
jgi:hypothetical protein